MLIASLIWWQLGWGIGFFQKRALKHALVNVLVIIYVFHSHPILTSSLCLLRPQPLISFKIIFIFSKEIIFWVTCASAISFVGVYRVLNCSWQTCETGCLYTRGVVAGSLSRPLSDNNYNVGSPRRAYQTWSKMFSALLHNIMI